jgi:hypothetical protein
MVSLRTGARQIAAHWWHGICLPQPPGFEPLAPQPRLIDRKPSAARVREWTRVDATFRARCVMNVQSTHWLDYDPVALVILVVGIGAVALLALSI